MFQDRIQDTLAKHKHFYDLMERVDWDNTVIINHIMYVYTHTLNIKRRSCKVVLMLRITLLSKSLSMVIFFLAPPADIFKTI